MKTTRIMAIIAAAILPATFACQQQADNYAKGTQKAYTVEAQMMLASIATSQLAYKVSTRSFGDTFAQIGFGVTGTEQRYTYFMGEDVLRGGRYFDELPESLPPPAVTENSFTVYAVANLDSDPDLDVWTISQGGSPRQLKKDY